MRSAVLVALFALVAVAFASNVVDLTPDNFDSYVDGSKGAFVEFFAPWCGHCKRLAPEYEIVGDTFANSKDVIVAKVDADQHRSLGSRFGVSGFPTLKYFPKGSKEPEDYSGGRSVDEIVSFINSRAGTRAVVKKAASAVVQLDSENFDSIVMDSGKDVVVEFYASWCGHCKSFAPEYEKIAKVFSGDSDVVIAQIDADKHKDIGSRFGIQGFPTIKFFPKGAKDAPEDVSIERNVHAFVNYVNEKTGTARKADGSLLDTAGRHTVLDDLAARFVAEVSNRAHILSEAEAAVKAATGRFAEDAAYYVKAMQQLLAKGESFAATESARLQRILDSQSVNPEKSTLFSIRRNILGAFQ